MMSTLKVQRIRWYGNRLFRAMVLAALTSILVITPVVKCEALEDISDNISLRQALRQRELLNQLVKYLTASSKVRTEQIYPEVGEKVNPYYSIFQKSLDWKSSHEDKKVIGFFFAPVSLLANDEETNNGGFDPLGAIVFYLEREK